MGASQQLTAVVHGSDNKQVRWSASAGTIPQRLFTAPSVTTAGHATVTPPARRNLRQKRLQRFRSLRWRRRDCRSQPAPCRTRRRGAYSAGLSATEDRNPTHGASRRDRFPDGVSLNDSECSAGNPSKTDRFSFTAKVTDGDSHTAIASLALAVDVVNTNSKFDGPAELPRVYVQSALAILPRWQEPGL